MTWRATYTRPMVRHVIKRICIHRSFDQMASCDAASEIWPPLAPGCGAQSCFTHKTPWHRGRTCADFDAEVAREGAAAAAAAAGGSAAAAAADDAKVLRLHNVKQCPRHGLTLVPISAQLELLDPFPLNLSLHCPPCNPT
jgi:hypothetical protein